MIGRYNHAPPDADTEARPRAGLHVLECQAVRSKHLLSLVPWLEPPSALRILRQHNRRSVGILRRSARPWARYYHDVAGHAVSVIPLIPLRTFFEVSGILFDGRTWILRSLQLQ